MRKAATYILTPVREFRTAAPPKTNIAVTMVFVISAKNKKTL
jgi:hypothetical protein